MSQTNPEEAPEEELGEAVEYDLAGNPLPPVRYDLAGNPLPSAGPPPSAHYTPPLSPSRPAAPGMFPPAAFTPPPGSVPLPGAAPAWGGGSPAAKSGPDGRILYGGLGVGALVLIGLIFALRAAKPVLVAAPASYTTYTAIDNTFSCAQPAGWEMKDTGAQGGSISTVTFRNGKARFHVVSDAAGSLMSETTASANANLPPEQQIAPVQKLHDTDKSELSDSFSDYQEGDAAKFTSAVGESRASEWTANRSAGTGSLHGYRVTMLDKDREITVICDCPERNWIILKPAFQKMINSIVPGNG